VVMVPKDFAAHLHDISSDPTSEPVPTHESSVPFQASFAGIAPKQHSSEDPVSINDVPLLVLHVARGVVIILVIYLAYAIVISLMDNHEFTSSINVNPTHKILFSFDNGSWLFAIVLEAGILVVALALITSTFRLDMDTSDVVYNHRETDELIFTSLMYRDDGKYALRHGDITRLNLAQGNYGKSSELFIHPPLFVWTARLLMITLGFGHVAAVVTMHLVTVLLTGMPFWTICS